MQEHHQSVELFRVAGPQRCENNSLSIPLNNAKFEPASTDPQSLEKFVMPTDVVSANPCYQVDNHGRQKTCRIG